MKSDLRYITALSLLISLVFLAAGCGWQETSGSGTGERDGFMSEYVDLGEGIGDMAFYYGMQQLGDELCYLSHDQNDDQVLDKYSLTDGAQTSVSFTWLESEERHYIAGFTLGEDGGIYALVYQYSGSDSAGSSSPAKQLCQFDAQGKQSFAVDIGEQLNEESGGFHNMLSTDAQGRIYIAGKTKVWLYDLQKGKEAAYQGEVSVCSGEESRISSVICGKDGKVYVCCRKGEDMGSADYFLVEIDFDKCRAGAVYENFPGAGGIALGMERDFLVHDDNDVYEYDLASKTMEPVLNWMENNVSGSGVQYFGTLTDGRIYAVTRDWGKEDSGLMLFSRATGEERADQKEEIILACLYYDGRLQTAVADFNRRSDNYKIVLQEYTEEERLLADITANCPDILPLNGLNVEKLAAAGVFEDLGAYLDKSQALDRSDYLENVLEAYTFDGSLVTIPSSFKIQTVAADAESLREVFGADFEGGWTVEDVMAYADANPGTELFDRVSKNLTMYYLMMYGKDSFIDWESGRCSFDSDRFKNVLEFVGRLPDETVETAASLPTRVEAGEVLLATAFISYFDDLQLYEEMFGGEAVFVGYPTADGSVGCSFYASDALAISARSSHKEGAWEFIESILADQNFDNTNDLMTNRTWLEQKMAAALSAEYATYDDGSPILDAEGRKVQKNYTVHSMEYYDGWTFSSHVPTEEEVQAVFSLIGQAVHRPDRESDVILNIISEEAEAYYQGQKSADEVAGIIQNRVQLYLEENRN